MTITQLVDAIYESRPVKIGSRGYNKIKEIVILPVQRVEDMSECWILLSHRARRTGYITINVGGKAKLAHRLSLELALGREILDGMTSSHLCETRRGNRLGRRCINPDHLTEETLYSNQHRKKQIGVAMPLIELPVASVD